MLLVLVSLLVTLSLAKTYEQVLSNYDIPLTAERVLVLAAAAHLDYDWQNWFPTNVNNTPPDFNNYFNPDPEGSPQWTNRIFSAAANLMNTSSQYHYYVTEMSFLQAFQEQLPEEWAKMMDSLGQLSIVGGGMTSPDNLLPHGETFLRTWLVAKQWMDSVGLPWSGHTWFPDDFGHDSQLPVLQQALGAISTGFGRIPGSCTQGGSTSTAPSAASYLLAQESGGLDFYWTASDGSTTIAHWLIQGYCQGACLANPESQYTSNGTLETLHCSGPGIGGSAMKLLEGFVNTNGPSSPTPAIFVPVGCDFMMPLSNLDEIVNQWNLEYFPSTGVYAVAETFSAYMDLVLAYEEENPGTLQTRSWHGSSASTVFRPNPYWTGFYAARMNLKILHQQATKLLLACESASYMSSLLTSTSYVGQIDLLWARLVVTTHHDFITGTAIDHVYNTSYFDVWGEQLAALTHCVEDATQLLDSILSNTLGFSSEQAVLYNPLSVATTNVVNLQSPSGPVQTLVTVPPLGYSVVDLLTAEQKGQNGAYSVHLEEEDTAPTTYTLSNTYLRATVALNSSSGWVVSSLIDLAGGQNILSGEAVGLSFWDDSQGTLYRFGFENPGCTFEELKYEVTEHSSTSTSGSLSVSVAAQATFSVTTVNGSTFELNYTYLFTLNVGEPFLRLSITGEASPNTAVLTSIPLPPVNTVEFGTTYHWEEKTPSSWNSAFFSPAFDATHDFVVPQNAAGDALIAVYHEALPTWGVADNVLWGCLRRNNMPNSPPCQDYGANGVDLGPTTLTFALRVPTGLASASTGQPRAEAVAYHTPPYVSYGKSHQTSATAPSWSTASIVGDSPVTITSLKQGTFNPSALILRLYNPTLTPTAVKVQLNLSGPFAIVPVTALEEPIGAATISADILEITCQYALTTVQVTLMD